MVTNKIYQVILGVVSDGKVIDFLREPCEALSKAEAEEIGAYMARRASKIHRLEIICRRVEDWG